MKKRKVIRLVARPSHLKVDKIRQETEGRNSICISANWKIDGKLKFNTNLNINNINDETVKKIYDKLGINQFADNTPLMVEIFVPEGDLLSDWTESQTHLDE